MFLKNLLLYHMCIIIPLLLLIVLMILEVIPGKYFVKGLLFYALIYHPLLSGLRLLSMKKIKRNEFLKNFIPFWNSKYFSTLFLGK
jgi:hypothetical protein